MCRVVQVQFTFNPNYPNVPNIQVYGHKSNVSEITSWHRISASFWIPMGVCRSDTWKCNTSMSDAPNVASIFRFSYMWNRTFLLAMERRQRRKRSRSSERTCCSFCSCSSSRSEATEEGMEVWHRAMKRGDRGSKPRLLDSGPFDLEFNGSWHSEWYVSAPNWIQLTTPEAVLTPRCCHLVVRVRQWND